MKSLVALSISAFLAVAIPSSAFAQSVNISAFPDNIVAEEGIESLAASAADNTAAIDSVAAGSSLAKHRIPMVVTAEDFITKVYGVLTPDRTKGELCQDCANILSLIPAEDNMGLWLDSADGYQLNYYGQKIPDVSAMATIENDSITNFGFFFLFPYEDTNKEATNQRQCLFCGSLLQEMQDIGVIMGVNTEADALFEATGDYKGNFVDVRLMDESTGENTGRYVLCLMVEPGTPNPADSMAAL